jgi:4'-phosphopantetheinyl transferase
VTAVAPWPPPAVPALGAGDVRVWSVDLDGEPDASVLDAGERERASRFVSDELTRRWTNARAGLRRVLAAYCGADPAELRIESAPCVHCAEPHGKPFLAEPSGHDLRFNLSHSDAMALVAVARGREVGVDAEAIRPGRRADGIASRWFTPEESDHLRGLGEAEAELAFYRLWTRKEAYLKATAAGVPGGLASFDALRLEPASGPEPGWEFADLDAGAGYAAALAVAPPGYRPGG